VFPGRYGTVIAAEKRSAFRDQEGQLADTPRLDPDLVQAFVNNAHGDLGRVRDLLERQPALVNAAWDWGGGDWETALGAAAHMGRKDIAFYLLQNGARMDIFAAAMLGYLEIVRAMLAAVPDARRWRGPHGIPLLKHAEAGEAEAAPVVDFLRTLECD
jgi:hypothetical protein